MQKDLLRGIQHADRTLKSIDAIRYGFIENEMLWAHMIGGAILGKVFILFFPPFVSLAIIFGIAVLWEIIEAWIETPNEKEMAAVYGSVQRYWYDTFGDIFGVIIMAAAAVF